MAAAVLLALSGTGQAGGDNLLSESSEQVAADLDSSFIAAEASCANGDVRAVRRQASLINITIKKQGAKLSVDQRKAYQNRLSGLTWSLRRSIDSLVNENLTVIGKKGKKAGQEYRQVLGRDKGLSETELAPVDQAIAEGGIQAAPEPPPLYSTPAEQAPPPAVAAPKPSAPARPMTPAAEPLPGNAEAERNSAAAREHATEVRGLLDAGKIEDARTVFRIHEPQIQRFLEPAAYKSLKASVDAAALKDEGRRKEAAAKVREIERLREANRIPEAFAALNKSRDQLKQNLNKEEYEAFVKGVNQAYAAFIQAQLTANDTARALRDLLAELKIEAAQATFEARRAMLKAGLSRDAFEGLNREVSAAYNALQDTKKRCELLCREIASLEQAGSGRAAAALFADNEALLKVNLDGPKFSALASGVAAAKKDAARRQARAFARVAAIDSAIAASRVEAAQAMFEESRDRLRFDLDDDKRFSALKDRLSDALADLHRKQQSATRTLQEIEDLIRRHEGRKAADLFRQESASLKKYCERKEYLKLENDVTLANAEYTAKSDAARKTAAFIEGLLSQEKVEQAYARYKSAEDDLDFYLGSDRKIEALGKKVIRSWNEVQERKDKAASMVAQIRRLIEKKQGKQAAALYAQNRADLARWVDSQTRAALAAEADRANKEHQAAESRIRQSAARLRAMLAQKKTEEAYAAFNAQESDLRFYLDTADFAVLEKQVESANSALQEKKQQALHIVKTLDRFLDAKRGDSAYAIFSRNRTFLAAHLNAETYAKAADRAAAGRGEREKNCRTAAAHEKNLYGVLNSGRVLEAEASFDKQRDFLETYLDKTAFTNLDAAVAAARDAFIAERKKARAVADALRRMIRQYQGVEAQAEFKRSEGTLRRFLPPNEYQSITAVVTSGYNSTLKGRHDAEEAAAAVRELIANDEIPYACATFAEMRQLLGRYLSSDKFTVLETEVAYYRNEHEKTVRRVERYAKSLRQLVVDNKAVDAYKNFSLHRSELNKCLDAQEFADLESTIKSAYQKAWKKAGKKR